MEISPDMTHLIFPPAASPTYVPLGVSLLKAHIDRTLGPGRLVVEDLNIRYWEYLTGLSAELADYRRFVRGEAGLFSRRFYEEYLPAARNLRAESSGFIDAVSVYLDRGTPTLALEALFLHLQGFLDPAVSTLMFSCLFPDQLLFALGFSRWLSAGRSCRIYLGGASTLLTDPGDLLAKAPWIGGIFTGEGEMALEQFLREGEDSAPAGYFSRKGPAPRTARPAGPAKAPAALQELPRADFSWAPLSSYFNPEPVLPVQFSRGCKWRRCRFCAHNLSFGRYRCLDAAGAVDMLSACRDGLGVSHFYFTDQYLDASFLEPFAREVLARDLKIRYTFMGRPSADMTAPVLELLHRSGCRWISWGVESGSRRLLDLAGKGTDPVEVSRVLKDSRRAGIHNLALLMFGLPGSDDQALEESFSFLQENRPFINAQSASEFLLYRGTPFGDHPGRYGLRITGAEVFCRIDGRNLESIKAGHVDLPRPERGEVEEVQRGPEEARRWKRRKPWLYPDTFWESLPAEHYLILASREEGDINAPRSQVS
jgi:anaerobic magnesium-protoporphyrin IX monomethyl ester cyclase